MIHIIPLDDIEDHKISEECSCGPRREEDLIIHNPWDGRDILEGYELISSAVLVN